MKAAYHLLTIMTLAFCATTSACVIPEGSIPPPEAAEGAQMGGFDPLGGDDEDDIGALYGCVSMRSDGDICNYACEGMSEAECKRTGDCVWFPEK